MIIIALLISDLSLYICPARSFFDLVGIKYLKIVCLQGFFDLVGIKHLKIYTYKVFKTLQDLKLTENQNLIYRIQVNSKS